MGLELRVGQYALRLQLGELLQLSDRVRTRRRCRRRLRRLFALGPTVALPAGHVVGDVGRRPGDDAVRATPRRSPGIVSPLESRGLRGGVEGRSDGVEWDEPGGDELRAVAPERRGKPCRPAVSSRRTTSCVAGCSDRPPRGGRRPRYGVVSFTASRMYSRIAASCAARAWAARSCIFPPRTMR